MGFCGLGHLTFLHASAHGSLPVGTMLSDPLLPISASTTSGNLNIGFWLSLLTCFLWATLTESPSFPDPVYPGKVSDSLARKSRLP